MREATGVLLPNPLRASMLTGAGPSLWAAASCAITRGLARFFTAGNLRRPPGLGHRAFAVPFRCMPGYPTVPVCR